MDLEPSTLEILLNSSNEFLVITLALIGLLIVFIRSKMQLSEKHRSRFLFIMISAIIFMGTVTIFGPILAPYKDHSADKNKTYQKQMQQKKEKTGKI